MKHDPGYDQLKRKTLDAIANGRDAWNVQSTGEKVCVALVLNRHDWLRSMSYTIPEAIDRAGEWIAWIPHLERELRDEGQLPIGSAEE